MSKPGQMFTQSNREFHKAVKDGDLKTVLARLDKGHNIEQVDGMNNTPLKNAIYSKRHDIISALLDRGANFDEGNVYMVCAHGDIVALKLLVAHGADFDAVDRRSWALQLHVVGPRGDHRGSARHRILNCRHLARHLASFLMKGRQHFGYTSA